MSRDAATSVNDWQNYETAAGTNPVASAKLQLNGHDRFYQREGSYFNLVQPYSVHTNIPESAGINCYSFGLRPEEHQPSGTCNMSRIDNATLNLTLDPTVGFAQVKIFASNYNVQKKGARQNIVSKSMLVYMHVYEAPRCWKLQSSQCTKCLAVKQTWPRESLGYGENHCKKDDQHGNRSVGAMTMPAVYPPETPRELLICDGLVSRRLVKVQSSPAGNYRNRCQNHVWYGRASILKLGCQAIFDITSSLHYYCHWIQPVTVT